MIFFKPNICFKTKTLDETAEDFYIRLENSNNSYEIFKLKEFVKENTSIKDCLKNEYNLTLLKSEKQLDSMEKYWISIKDDFFDVISSVLDFDFIGEVEATCLIDCLPFPFIDLKRRRLTLSVNDSLDNNVCYALGVVVKYFILNKYTENNAKDVVYNYSKDSVYWIMADLVADSLFFHTKLGRYASNTAYKYYYGLKIQDINIMEYLRNIYPQMDIIEFIDFVLDFVKRNIDIFTKFTNRY